MAAYVPVSRSSFWEQLFRSSGLAIVHALLHKARRKAGQEEAKVVIDKSRGLALGRCAVHILPTSASIVILWVNFQQVFIGIDFRSLIRSETVNIALLQTAAKVQELLIVASLATVAFQLLRYELVYGNGLPLGLLAAGFDFAKLSWLWSPEFVACLWKPDRGPGKLRRAAIVLYLIIATALAALAGPSCAVLLIPQSQEWAAGGTDFYLNGTADELWPTTLSALSGSLGEFCNSADATRCGVCPSGGYYSLLSHYARSDGRTYNNEVPPYARRLSGNNAYWSFASSTPVSTRTVSLMLGDGSAQNPTGFVQPTLGVSIVLEQLTQDWWHSLQSKRGYAGYNIEDRIAESDTTMPTTRVRCSAAQNMSASDHIVAFPIPESDLKDSQNLSRRALNSEPSRHLQFRWVPLPGQGGHISTGAVLQSPWTSDNRSRIVIGCIVYANWAPAGVLTDGYSFWQGWYPGTVLYGERYPLSGHTSFNHSIARDGMDSIAVDEDWLSMLTPPTGQRQIGYPGWLPTTIESVLHSAHLVDDLSGNGTRTPTDIWHDETHTRRRLLESIIASMFNDGLARVGIEKAFDQQGTPLHWTPLPLSKAVGTATGNVTRLRVHFTIRGLSYQLTLTQKLSAAVLLLHILIALVHSAWIILWTGESSSSWDSIVELVVLAQNSHPAFSALRNTAAGIKHSSTFARKVSIRPTSTPGSLDTEHLEMVYEDEAVRLEDAEMSDLQKDNTSDIPLRSRRAIHSSTWTERRAYNRTSPSKSLAHTHDEELTPTTPLIDTELGDTSSVSLAARVQVGHAYR